MSSNTQTFTEISQQKENKNDQHLSSRCLMTVLGVLAHFPPGVFLGLEVLAHFTLWGIIGLGSFSTFWTISSLYVVNCFKYFLVYILEQNVSKSDKKNFKLYQVLMCWFFWKIF